jgi:putative membrane protein
MRHGSPTACIATALLLGLAGCAESRSEAPHRPAGHPPIAAQAEEPPPGNPAGMMPATAEQSLGTPMPHATNVADRIFVGQAALSGLAEVALAEQAAGRAGGGVASFAQQMIQDHGAANQQLAGLAQAAGIHFPTALHPADEAERQRQRGLSGRAFETAYIDQQVTAHQQAVQLLQWQFSNGQDPALRQFAADQLPVVSAHLEMARSLQSQLRQLPPVAVR